MNVLDFLNITKVTENNIEYSLNIIDNTASVIGNSSASGKIFIPRSIKLNSQEYIVTTISSGALIIARRDIKTATIPSFIKVIKPFAFFSCEKLEKVEFTDDSNLLLIGEYAFCYSSIETFYVPPKLKSIFDFAFSECKVLKKLIIPDNAQLNKINKSLFHGSSLEEITIPSNLVVIKDEWCSYLIDVVKINVSPKNPIYSSYCDIFIIGKSSPEKEFHDVLLFAVRDLKSAVIPSFIEIIGTNAFELCFSLRNVEYDEFRN